MNPFPRREIIYGEVMTRLAKLGGSLPTLKSNQPTLTTQKNYGQGRGGRPWQRLKRAVHVRDGWTCCKCQRVTMNPWS